MDKYEDILRSLNKKDSIERIPGKPKDEECVDNATFSLYMDKLLDGKEIEKVEQHFIYCKACRQKNIALQKIKSQIENKDLLKAPARATAKAKQLVKAPHGLIEVILEFARESVRIIKNTGSVLQQLELVPALSRGMEADGQEAVENTAFLVNEFNGLIVALTIEKVSQTECEIEARTTDAQSGEPIDNIRLNLLFKEKELASYLTRHGYLAFKNLSFNTYKLEVVRKRETLGIIELKLRSVQ